MLLMRSEQPCLICIHHSRKLSTHVHTHAHSSNICLLNRYHVNLTVTVTVKVTAIMTVPVALPTFCRNLHGARSRSRSDRHAPNGRLVSPRHHAGQAVAVRRRLWVALARRVAVLGRVGRHFNRVALAVVLVLVAVDAAVVVVECGHTGRYRWRDR